MVLFAEFFWRCILRKQLEKLLAIILCVMSAAILLAEATLLPSRVHLSLFSILINSVKKQEVLVQVDYNILLDSIYQKKKKKIQVSVSSRHIAFCLCWRTVLSSSRSEYF